MMSKKELVNIVLKEIPEYKNLYINSSTDTLISQWFVSKRSTNNLELTLDGKTALELADIEYYDRVILRSSIYLLPNNIYVPYFLFKENKKEIMIRLYDSQITVTIDLYGSIEKYLEIQTNDK